MRDYPIVHFDKHKSNSRKGYECEQNIFIYKLVIE